MPTVLRSGPYRFFFYANDRDEPYHIHVEHGEHTAKYLLDPIRLQSSSGFNRLELRKISSIISENHSTFIEVWNAYFSNKN